MRIFVAAGLMGAAVVSLAACSKSAPDANGAPAAGGSSPAAALGAPGPLTAADFPHRKPGLWTQQMGMDGTPTGPGMKMCVDATSEAKMSVLPQKMPGGGHCTMQFNRGIDGSITLSSTCDMGANGKSTTTGVIKGDFNSSYTETMDIQYAGSPVAAMNGHHTMTIVGTWTGPCPPGEKGGDLTLGNGATHNILDDDGASNGASN
jgi:hypothetical protein